MDEPVVAVLASDARVSELLSWLRSHPTLLAGATLACRADLIEAVRALGGRAAALPSVSTARLALAVVLEHPDDAAAPEVSALVAEAARRALAIAATTQTADLLLKGHLTSASGLPRAA